MDKLNTSGIIILLTFFICRGVANTGLYFLLNGVTHQPGDIVLISDIGVGFASSLVCKTDSINTHCCRGSDNPNGSSLGDWYFPNGTVVPRLKDSRNGNFTRVGSFLQIRLTRQNNAIEPLGTYTCVVPDQVNSTLNHTATITLLNAICYTASNCGGSGAVVTQEDCCTHGIGPIGFSFRNGINEECKPCPIVLGFNTTVFRGEEQGASHAVEVGYISGSPHNNGVIIGTIQVTFGTAGVGDIHLSGRTLRIPPNSLDPQLVTFVLMQDGVAQEMDETFNLTLTLHTATLLPGATLVDKVQGTIVDTDLISFEIPKCGYWERERPNATIPIQVRTSRRVLLANPVILKVIPLTVGAAQDMGIIDDFPDDKISPNRAQEADFDGTEVNITFPANENMLRPITEVQADVTIVDDEINEADEQQFIVFLEVVSGIDTSHIRIVQNMSICHIIDDDPLQIGFLQSAYEFEEPNHRILYMNVTLVKENNVTTEQTYSVAISTTSLGGLTAATLESNQSGNYDYSLGHPGQPTAILRIDPDEQSVTFPFFLNHDELPEGTETFQARAIPSDGFPTYRNPSSLFAETLISIRDNDIITVGFEMSKYSVNETDGFVEVCVIVINPPSSEDLAFDIITEYQSRTGTADEHDFTPLVGFNRFMVSTGSSAPRRDCFRVTISRDNSYELNEEFILVLGKDTSNSSLLIQPNTTEVTIFDTDDIVIGFLNLPYYANENDGNAYIEIGVVSGSLQREVSVEFSLLNNGSAILGSDFSYSGRQTFTFDAANSTFTLRVPLINDSIFELSETFLSSLSFSGPPPERVIINPATAIITILDDDAIGFEFYPTEYLVREDGGLQTVSVALTGEFDQELSFSVTAGTDDSNLAATATAELDFTAVSTTLNFSRNAKFKSFDVPILVDNIAELREDFLLSVSIPSTLVRRDKVQILSNHERSRIGVISGSVRISDDDRATIGFDPVVYNVSEGVGEVNFTYRVLQGELGYSVAVNFYTSEGSATSGVDYDGNNGRVTTLTGTGSVDIPITLNDDEKLEGPEVFFGYINSTLGSLSNVLFIPLRATVNIIDDDEVVIGFINQPYNISEDDGAACVEVGVISGILVRNVAVHLSFFSKSALSDRDYQNYTGSPIYTFNATHRSYLACVSLIKDDIFELTEVFEAKLRLFGQPPSPLVSLASTTTTVTILDDDMLSFNFHPSIYQVSESAGSVDLNVSLNGHLGRFTAFLSVGIDDSNTLTTARVIHDYIMLPPTILTFTGNMRFQTFGLTLVSDTIPEQVETIIINITDVVITFNGGQVLLTQQERNRIKFPRDHARVSIYDTCRHGAPVVMSLCVAVGWQVPNRACGPISGYDILFVNIITGEKFSDRRNASDFLYWIGGQVLAIGSKQNIKVQVRVINGTWSEPKLICG